MKNDKGRSRGDFRLAVLAFFIFLVLFIYSSLNLKNVDLGYRQHELLLTEKQLRSEIDSLQARKAGLLNLERMERVAMEELGYQYPQAGQIIKVVDNGHER
jgi:cell division protein FtsL